MSPLPNPIVPGQEPQRNDTNLDHRFPITTADIQDTAITDGKLASPNNSVYRSIFHASAGGTGILTVSATNRIFKIDGSWVTNTAPRSIYLDDADYAVAGKTTMLRMRAQLFTNATDPGAIDITVGLSSFGTAVGGVGAISFTVANQLAGSTVTFTNAQLAANVELQGNSGDFAFPADGDYAPAVVATGGGAADCYIAISTQLQMRHV